MQLALNGGTSSTVTVDTTGVTVPITGPVLALGVSSAGAIVEVPAGMPAGLNATLMMRWWATDDSQSAGNWVAIGTAVVGPDKVFKSGSVGAIGGAFIQLGLKLNATSGTVTGRGRLISPAVVVV